jgi:hypothetical protein
MISGQTYPQERLSQAVGAILQRQLVAFLVIWLAVGFPVMCQLHGIMSLYDMEPHEHPGHRSADNSEYPCSIHDHSTVPGITMLLSLITGLVPDQIACHYSIAAQNLAPLAIRWPLQLIAFPLDQPPRSV